MVGRFGCLWMIMKGALWLAAFVAIAAVLGFPWAIPLPGRDTLNGKWVGEVRSSSGPRAWLYVNLTIVSSHMARRLSDRQRLGHDAILCTSRRRVDLDVLGSTTAWSGKTIELSLEPSSPSPPELRFDVKGTWDGHTLELRESDHSLGETLNEPADVAVAEPQRASRWIAATLRRGTRSDFDAACARLGGQR